MVVRREVWRRDEGRCTFVGFKGKRCYSADRPELHHIIPDARGGLPTPDNLTVHCKAHNRLCAEKDFGAVFMSRYSTRGPPPGR